MRPSFDFTNAPFLFIFTFAYVTGSATVCPDIPGGTVVEYEPGKCIYVRQTVIYEQDNAKQECLRLGPQPNEWRLPKLDSAEKRDKINSAIRGAASQQSKWIMWLDLIRDDPTDTEKNDASLWADLSKWRWSDNTTLNNNGFTSWGPNEPNQHLGKLERCATSYASNGRWNDVNCDVSPWPIDYRGYLLLVCEFKANSEPTPAVTKSSDMAQSTTLIPPAPIAADNVKIGQCLQQSKSLLSAVVFGDICLVFLVCAVLLAGYHYWKQSRQNNADKSSFVLSSVAGNEINGRHNPNYQKMDNDSASFSMP